MDYHTVGQAVVDNPPTARRGVEEYRSAAAMKMQNRAGRLMLPDQQHFPRIPSRHRATSRQNNSKIEASRIDRRRIGTVSMQTVPVRSPTSGP